MIFFRYGWRISACCYGIGNIAGRDGVFHASSACITVRSAVRYAVLHCGRKRYVVEYLVVGVGVQRQRDVQWTDVSVCVRLQVSRLHRRVYVDLSTEGQSGYAPLQHSDQRTTHPFIDS